MQRDVFAESEGAAWFNRNKADLGKRDPVMEAMGRWHLKPKSILEIGCSNGWRVERLIDRYGCKVHGIDPAVTDIPAMTRLYNLRHGHAAALFHYSNAEFDTLIYGFCLYLCDPSDYPAIVKEGDRVLADGGHIIIHDFAIEENEEPWRTPYKHKDGLFSYHVDFAALWTAFPQYKEISETEIGYESVRILRKNLTGAFVDRPTP